jgi:hypothetical protein
MLVDRPRIPRPITPLEFGYPGYPRALPKNPEAGT